MQRCPGTEGQRDTRLQVSKGSRLCNWEPSKSRGRLGKQGEPINKATWPPGPGGRAKSRRLFRQQRDGAAARDKYGAPTAAQHCRSPTRQATLPRACALCECRNLHTHTHTHTRAHPGPAALHTSHPTLVPVAACVSPASSQLGASPGSARPINPSSPSVTFALGTMPFLGQDWRSPGQSWVKTADGWKRFLDEKSGSFVSDLSR